MNLIDLSFSVLADAKSYLNHISSAEYSKKIPLMSNSTIGQHTRHFVEFYLCLIHQEKDNVINYCQRKRDLLIETDPQKAITAINYIIEHLEPMNLDKHLNLYTENEDSGYIDSNVGREIYYNIEHTIHHLALIKIALKIVTPHIEIPSHFGVAPSTIKHREAMPAASH